MSSKAAESGAHGTVVKKFGKGQRSVPSAAERAPKYYPSEDVRQAKQVRIILLPFRRSMRKGVCRGGPSLRGLDDTHSGELMESAAGECDLQLWMLTILVSGSQDKARN